MASYCLDASAVLAWLLESGLPRVDMFWSELDPEDNLIAAELLRPECTSVLRESVFDKVITTEQADVLVHRLISMPLLVNRSNFQFPRAMELARQFQTRKAYDMQYLAVAELEGIELVTVDRVLRHAAREVGVPVRWLR